MRAGASHGMFSSVPPTPMGMALVVVCVLAACGDEGAGTSPVVYEAAPLCERRPDLPCAEAAELTLSAPTIVAPSAAMPEGVTSQVAHNNLDVAWHNSGDGGRLFFAFRTGPNHFASPDVVMYIVSTEDLLSWRKEGEVRIGTDVREPQLVPVGGELLFFYVVLGADPLDFEPRGTKVMRWLGPGQFSEPEDIFEPGFLVWRIKPFDQPGHEPGWLQAFGYSGGENVYDFDGEPIRVSWLKSIDGLAWEPVDPEREIVLTGGASETDAVFLPDGRLIALARNEAGDTDGFGSKICRGEASSPAQWTCAFDKKKYDSPLLFAHEGTPYLIGRRNLTETGDYDLGETEKTLRDRALANQLDYWQRPKRCALWRIDPDALTVTWLIDLPSAGDTCFPEALRLSRDRWLVFNYSSPHYADPDAPDPSWLDGQLGPTHIYWTVLGFPPTSG